MTPWMTCSNDEAITRLIINFLSRKYPLYANLWCYISELIFVNTFYGTEGVTFLGGIGEYIVII